MIEKGEVIKVDKKNVVVSFERKTECDKCGMCAFGKDDMKVKVTLKNNVDAKIGDIVEVSMGDKFVLASAIIVYLIPIVLIGIFLGIAVFLKLSEIVQIVLALTGFVLGFIISSVVDKLIKNKKSFSPKITKIIGNINDIENDSKNNDIVASNESNVSENNN